MKIDLSPLLKEVGANSKYSFTEDIALDLGEDASLTGPVSLIVTLTNTGMGIVAKGEISTTINLNCAICLKDFTEKLSITFEERFIEDTKVIFPDDKDYEVQDNDIFFTYDSNLSLDFSELIRELIILNLPIAPKCDINCQVQEQENKKTIDPRLSVLAKLKTED